MLRITVHHDPGLLTFQVEGKLIGQWVLEAKECWRRTLASQPSSSLRLDLTGVTMIDAAGKALLTAAHKQGAKIVASGCMTRAIVAELTRASIPARA